MRRTIIPFAALLGLVVALPTTQAAVILADKFDTYANQAAFEAAWTPIGTVTPISADLSTAQAKSSPNSVEIDAEPTSGGVNGKQRNQRTFTETGTVSPTQNIMFSFDFYDTNAAAAPYRQYANLQDSTNATGANQLISLGLNNNQTIANSGGNYYMARILGYTVPTTADPDGGPNESVGGAGAYFKLNDFGVGLRSTGWHNLRVVLSSDDGLTTDYDFYVDGMLAERVQNVAGALRSYDLVRIGSGFTNAGNAAYYDNVRVQTGTQLLVPEPATLALLALSLLGLVGTSRRR